MKTVELIALFALTLALMPSFAQVLLRPRKASRQSRPISLLVPPLTFRLVTWQRTSFSEPLVCSGITDRSSTMSNSRLLP
jgi:hypothetical protein